MNAKIAFLLLLLLPNAFAWEREFFWNGQISLMAEKSELNAGETLNLSVRIDNLANAPLADAYLVVQLVRIADGEGFLFYRENIIAEKISERYSLRPKESKTVVVNLKIPEYAPEGSYRVDAYLKTPRTYVVGVPHIFVYPTSLQLSIKNSSKQRDIAIDRENTLICGPLSEANFEVDCYAGPVGVIVEPEKKIKITVAVKNNSQQEERNLKLKLMFYYYDDTLLEAAVKNFVVNIDRIAPNSTWKKEVDVLTPKKPGAYPVRIVLADAEGNILSIFRHRVNVKGMSSRLVFLYPDRIYYKKGSTAKIVARFLSPSDASTEGSATIEVYLMKGTDKLYSEKRTIKLTQRVPIRTEEFNFNLKEALQDFTVGALILDSANNILDSYEQRYYYSSFSRALSSLELFTSPDAEFRELTEHFIVASPIYVKVKATDDRGLDVRIDGKLYIESDDLSLGPFEFKGNTQDRTRTEAGNIHSEVRGLQQNL
ncbi:MAG: hypothetical protein J7L44_04300 [Candidatus Diapherotrites archaeon]|nr:hypothetical protein [Candidatus Diapherotrites archaeon]